MVNLAFVNSHFKTIFLINLIYFKVYIVFWIRNLKKSTIKIFSFQFACPLCDNIGIEDRLIDISLSKKNIFVEVFALNKTTNAQIKLGSPNE